MGILAYIPKKVAVIDRRTDEGGYYIATCEYCEREFYPKRSNAKYCNAGCSIANWRKKRAEKPKEVVKSSKKGEKIVLEGSGKTIATFFKKWKLKGYVYDVLRDMDVGDKYSPKYEDDEDDYPELDSFIVEKVSERKYILSKI